MSYIFDCIDINLATKCSEWECVGAKGGTLGLPQAPNVVYGQELIQGSRGRSPQTVASFRDLKMKLSSVQASCEFPCCMGISRIMGISMSFSWEFPCLVLHGSPRGLGNKLNTLVNTAQDWYRENSMQSNPIKFQSIFFGKTPKCSIVTSNVNIESTGLITLLGVSLDAQLNFNNHVSNICTKAGRNFKCDGCEILDLLTPYFEIQEKMHHSRPDFL